MQIYWMLELDYSFSRHLVHSFMQQQGLVAIQPLSFVPRTTDSQHGKRIGPNLLLDQSLPTSPVQGIGKRYYLPAGGKRPMGIPGKLDGFVFAHDSGLAGRKLDGRHFDH